MIPIGSIELLSGQAGITGVFRVDLAATGAARIGAITVADDGLVSGGSDGFSGLDLDFVRLSTTAASTAEAAQDVPALADIAADPGRVTLTQGFLRDYQGDFPENLRTGFLFGTNGTDTVDPRTATLDTRDAANGGLHGSVSIGEGGAITFELAEPVSTNGVYLYVGERFGNDLPLISVSAAETGTDEPDGGEVDDGTADNGDPDGGDTVGGSGPGGDKVGVSGPDGRGTQLVGTSGDDSLVLGSGANAGLGGGADSVAGADGDDTIDTAAGDDVVSGGPGADVLTGGPGRDVFRDSLADFDGDRMTDFSPFDSILATDGAGVTVSSRFVEGDTLLDLDANGDGAAEATLTLDGIHGGRFLTAPGDDGGTVIRYLDTQALIYAGYYGRAPDPEGFDFWAGELARGVPGKGNKGEIFVDIANSFAVDQETRDLYPFLADPEPSEIEGFLNDVYRNLFNRDLGTEGLEYWGGEIAAELEAGRPVGRVIIDIVSGARDTDAFQDLTTLYHKSQAAWYYKTYVAAEAASWSLDDDAAGARATIADVGPDLDSVDASVREIHALFGGAAQSEHLV